VNAFELADARVRYANGAVALDGIDLTVGDGERVALVGRSGAGKSTLINLLNGRLVLDGALIEGRVDVLGVDPREARGRAGRRHALRIGTIRQDHDLVGPLRVIHNVNAGRLGAWSTGRALRSLARPIERAEVERALALVGLDPAIADVRVDELSGGQRQRVALARVLRQAPDLVLADEPVASLDPALSEAVLELLADPPADSWSTSVVSLHQPEYARRFAQRVVGMRRGRIDFDVPVDELTDRLLNSVYDTA
jgi:phosphonate transport system ATP-binding protein